MVDIQRFEELIVHQEVEYLEVFTGFETENRYSVSTPEGEILLYAYEESGWLGRQFLSSHRALNLHFVDSDGELVLTATRKFFWFLSHLHVEDADGRPIGSLRRRFGVFKRRFSLEDGNGKPIGEVQGPLLRPHTFMIYKDDTEIARVTKQWGGILREGFSDADTFKVQFDHSSMDQDFAHLVLATALAIDLDFFESKGGGAGF